MVFWKHGVQISQNPLCCATVSSLCVTSDLCPQRGAAAAGVHRHPDAEDSPLPGPRPARLLPEGEPRPWTRPPPLTPPTHSSRCYQVQQLQGVYNLQEPHFWTLCTDVYIGTLKLLVAPDADARWILSQTHHIFTQVPERTAPHHRWCLSTSLHTGP